MEKFVTCKLSVLMVICVFPKGSTAVQKLVIYPKIQSTTKILRSHLLHRGCQSWMLTDYANSGAYHNPNAVSFCVSGPIKTKCHLEEKMARNIFIHGQLRTS